MENRKFDGATALAIRELVSEPECLEVRDDGLYVAEPFSDRALAGEGPSRAAGSVLFDWTPSEDMDWPGAPNPLTAPALPIPFTAAELAAFLLDGGAGLGVQELLDHRIGYPLRTEALSHLSPKKRELKAALTAAYELAAAAQLRVGEYDLDAERRAYDRADAANEEGWRASRRERGLEPEIFGEANARRDRARASVAELRAKANAAVSEAEAKRVAWRKAMVHQLLGPGLEAAKGASSVLQLGGTTETTQERQARRFKMCVKAGLPMPDNDYAALPRGIGRLARAEGISPQAFSKDVKAHIARSQGRDR